jgi:plastocyanin
MLRKTAVALLLAAFVAFPAAAGAAPVAQTITAKETNFKITFSAKPRHGTVKFIVKNAAKGVNHDLWIKGGGKTWHTKVLKPGQHATLTTTLKKGVKYTAWCKVDSHAKLGMKRTFVAK